MTRTLDPKKKVYSAEDTLRELVGETIRLYGSTIVVPEERKIGSQEAAQVYADKVLALPQVQHAYEMAQYPVRVMVRGKSPRAYYQLSKIVLPDTPFGLSEITLLHEIAHHLVTGCADTSHDRKFRLAFLFLLQEAMGPEAALIVRAEYHKRGL